MGAERRRRSPGQRLALRRVARRARKRPGEPLTPDAWSAYFEFAAQPMTRFGKRVFRMLPSTPRCGYCGAPFGGIGSRLVGPFGYRPSRKNPNVCSVCVEAAPPGGITTDVGVLFADLRGFTTRAKTLSPEATSTHLRRFYASAEHVLLPEALVDKVIGDEVMAPYVPHLVRSLSPKAPPRARCTGSWRRSCSPTRERFSSTWATAARPDR